VDLIIQCSPPKDAETYIHRSGRTGRAGKYGVSLTFYTKREEPSIKLIEKKIWYPISKSRYASS